MNKINADTIVNNITFGFVDPPKDKRIVVIVDDKPFKFTGIILHLDTLYWVKNGIMHRLDGPSVVGPSYDVFGSIYTEYHIEGWEIERSEFWKQPAVIETTLKNIIQL